jgi:lysozyme family protein
MPTDETKSIIDAVLKAEGGSTVTNDPQDGGGRTQFGISEKANPTAWADGKVTEDEARAIYEAKYVKGPGFDKVSHLPLRTQLVDFGVNSGPSIAVQKLQSLLGVNQDGILGPNTLTALEKADQPYLNNELAKARVLMIGRLVQKNPGQVKFLVGWLDRALGFFR